MPAMVAARKVELVFELSLPLAPDSSKSLVLPLLPVDRITVPATLPSLAVRSSFKTQLTQAKPAHWHDPITLRPAVALTLTVDVKSDSSGPWDDVIDFRISPQPGQRILSGKESFTCKAPGTYTIPFTVEAPALTSVGAKSSPIKIAMAVGPDSAPANHTVEPKDMLVSLEVQPPASIQTKLTTQTKSISAPRWIDVINATTVFEAEVQFVVDGPLAKDTVITVQCPPAVRNIKFHPATIQSGTQIIRFTIEAELAPSPAKKTLVFLLQAPAAQGGVQITPPPPLRLTVTGPDAIQLALSQDRAVPLSLNAQALDDQISMSVTPILIGAENVNVDGILASVRSGPKLDSSAMTNLALNIPFELVLKTTAKTEPSFFFDQVIYEELSVIPLPTTPAVVGSKQQVVIRIEAPFKRLLFYLTGAFSVLLVLFLLARMYQRLTSHQEC